MTLPLRIETVNTINMVGKCSKMSLNNDHTQQLWQEFMPRIKGVSNRVGRELYSVQIYDDLSNFSEFDAATKFEKWAAVRVSDFNNFPEGFKTLKVPAGLYAVFSYQGKASEATTAFQYIFGVWLPASEYVLDQRPHLSIMGEKYDNEKATSEEEFWIPVKKDG